MTYRITVRTISKNIPIAFKGVEDYKIEDGLLIFTDSKYNKVKRFAVSNTEIEEE